MKFSTVLRLIGMAILVGVTAFPTTQARGQPSLQKSWIEKPPEVIQGGTWSDDFWIGQLQEAENIDVQVSHLILKYKEQLHWTQTWTSHFTGGTFWQTEASADSVRLAWNEAGQNYFTMGTYISAVFDAGKPVDWATAEWRYSRIPDGLIVEFRTGNTPTPDDTWTNWQIPDKGFMQSYCAYTFNSDETQCFTNLKGINSSQYIQYRASFHSDDATKTVSFYEIDFIYGIHVLTGSALSIPIPPVDLLRWESVPITSTIPENTTMVIDVLAPDGTVLIPDVHNGSSLEGIDPNDYPALQLRVTFATGDESITPDIDRWGLKWSVWNRVFLPVIQK